MPREKRYGWCSVWALRIAAIDLMSLVIVSPWLVMWEQPRYKAKGMIYYNSVSYAS